MSLKSRIFAGFSTVMLLAGAGCVDPDPGQCWTTGEFDESYVETNTTYRADVYVDMVCADWVNMLLANCVDVYGLPLLPTQSEIDNYCSDIRREGDGTMSFEIDHSCNFIDNPNYECSMYASNGSEPGAAEWTISSATNAELERMLGDIENNENLSSSMDDVMIHLDGGMVQMPMSEFVGR